MTNAGQIVAAFRDMAATKSLSQEELYDLMKDGIMAGLARIHGPNVQAEIEIHEDTGDIQIVVLKRVVEEVEDPRRPRSPSPRPGGTTPPSRWATSWRFPWTSPSSGETPSWR
jgi:hypothetical protein